MILPFPLLTRSRREREGEQQRVPPPLPSLLREGGKREKNFLPLSRKEAGSPQEERNTLSPFIGGIGGVRGYESQSPPPPSRRVKIFKGGPLSPPFSFNQVGRVEPEVFSSFSPFFSPPSEEGGNPPFSLG